MTRVWQAPLHRQARHLASGRWIPETSRRSSRPKVRKRYLTAPMGIRSGTPVGKSVKGIPAQVDAKAANSTADKTGSASGVINALLANVPASPTARLFLWLRTPYIAHVPGVSFGGNHDQDIRVAD